LCAEQQNGDTSLDDELSVVPRPRAGARYAAVLAFIAIWMGCGWLFPIDANAYLILGLPFTVAFQRLIRRQPLRALWLAEAPAFRLGRKGIAIGVALSLLPAVGLLSSLVDFNGVEFVFGLGSIVGAFGAAYALVHFRREHVFPLLGCLIITLALDAVQWSLFFGLGLVEMKSAEGGVPEQVAVGVVSFIQYMAIVFALEEVTFRMLDTHLHEADSRRGILSAVVISVLWGLWHLPIGNELSWASVGVLLYVHVPYGVCLSLFWRKTGNLVIPAFCHALGDGIRNALLAGG
jgi:membrane protease YdiL (CAAX protease family)